MGAGVHYLLILCNALFEPGIRASGGWAGAVRCGWWNIYNYWPYSKAYKSTGCGRRDFASEVEEIIAPCDTTTTSTMARCFRYVLYRCQFGKKVN